MPIVNVTLPSDGTGADVADYNAPINAILAVVNGHLAADNMEPGSLDWSVMPGAMSNVIPSQAMQDSGNLEKFRDEGNIAFILSGMVWSLVSGLNGTMTSGIYYSLNGIRYAVGSIASRAFTASKDTYVSVSPTGSISYQEAVNGGAIPALSTDYQWVAKVITNGSTITSVVDMRKMTPTSNRVRRTLMQMGAEETGGSTTFNNYGKEVKFASGANPSGFGRFAIRVPQDYVPGTPLNLVVTVMMNATQSMTFTYYIELLNIGDDGITTPWNYASNVNTSSQSLTAKIVKEISVPITSPIMTRGTFIGFAIRPNAVLTADVEMLSGVLEYTADC